jgi:hypothetical protein
MADILLGEILFWKHFVTKMQRFRLIGKDPISIQAIISQTSPECYEKNYWKKKKGKQIFRRIG